MVNENDQGVNDGATDDGDQNVAGDDQQSDNGETVVETAGEGGGPPSRVNFAAADYGSAEATLSLSGLSMQSGRLEVPVDTNTPSEDGEEDAPPTPTSSFPDPPKSAGRFRRTLNKPTQPGPPSEKACTDNCAMPITSKAPPTLKLRPSGTQKHVNVDISRNNPDLDEVDKEPQKDEPGLQKAKSLSDLNEEDEDYQEALNSGSGGAHNVAEAEPENPKVKILGINSDTSSGSSYHPPSSTTSGTTATTEGSDEPSAASSIKKTAKKKAPLASPENMNTPGMVPDEEPSESDHVTTGTSSKPQAASSSTVVISRSEQFKQLREKYNQSPEDKTEKPSPTSSAEEGDKEESNEGKQDKKTTNTGSSDGRKGVSDNDKGAMKKPTKRRQPLNVANKSSPRKRVASPRKRVASPKKRVTSPRKRVTPGSSAAGAVKTAKATTNASSSQLAKASASKSGKASPRKLGKPMAKMTSPRKRVTSESAVAGEKGVNDTMPKLATNNAKAGGSKPASTLKNTAKGGAGSSRVYSRSPSSPEQANTTSQDTSMASQASMATRRATASSESPMSTPSSSDGSSRKRASSPRPRTPWPKKLGAEAKKKRAEVVQGGGNMKKPAGATAQSAAAGSSVGGNDKKITRSRSPRDRRRVVTKKKVKTNKERGRTSYRTRASTAGRSVTLSSTSSSPTPPPLSRRSPARASAPRIPPKRGGRTKKEPEPVKPVTAKATKAGPAKAGPSKAGTAKAGPSKAGPSKAGPAKAGTATAVAGSSKGAAKRVTRSQSTKRTVSVTASPADSESGRRGVRRSQRVRSSSQQSPVSRLVEPATKRNAAPRRGAPKGKRGSVAGRR